MSDHSPEHSPERETVNRESHPNAGGPEGLAGDMGISSEREGPFDGIEGMGSQVSTQGATEGESPTFDDTDQRETADDPTPSSAADSADLDKPDRTSPATGVDRTAGEVQPDPIRDEDKQTFDPSRNPGH